jgi:hypothetical protein
MSENWLVQLSLGAEVVEIQPGDYDCSGLVIRHPVRLTADRGDVHFRGKDASSLTICTTGRVEIAGIQFSDGDGEAGSAIRLEGGSLLLRGCGFQNNSASRGGAISVERGELVATDCVFYSNRAYAGGAVWVSEGARATFGRCHFDDNEAVHGSAIAIELSAYVEMTDVVCHDPKSDHAHIHLQGGAGGVPRIRLTRVTFSGKARPTAMNDERLCRVIIEPTQ